MIKWACCFGFSFFCFFNFRPTRRFRKHCLAEWVLKWVNASRRLLVSDFSHPVLWIFLRGTSCWNAALDRWLSAKLFLFLCRQPPSHWLTIDFKPSQPGAKWSGPLRFPYKLVCRDVFGPSGRLCVACLIAEGSLNISAKVQQSAPSFLCLYFWGGGGGGAAGAGGSASPFSKKSFSQMKTSHEYLSRVWQFDSGHKWHS